MKDEYLERTIGLLGEDSYQTLKDKCVAIIGLGGVGGTALEALTRSGVNHLVIVDFDQVDSSNLNRQILFNESDIGQSKVEAAKSHLLKIDSSLDIIAINYRVDENISSVLKEYNIDFIVDAIDDVKGKVALAKYASEHQIPYIMSLGMANRLDPTKVSIVRLDKTTNDPLAKKLRHEFKEAGLDTKNFITAVSSETPMKDGSKLNSMMMVPSSAGLAIAYYVISYLIK